MHRIKNNHLIKLIFSEIVYIYIYKVYKNKNNTQIIRTVRKRLGKAMAIKRVYASLCFSKELLNEENLQ